MKFNYLFIASALFIFSCSSNTNNAEQEELQDTVQQEEVVENEVAEQAVFFGNLEEGAEVKSPVKIQMGVKGMQVEPAGAISPNMGHHHLIIDGSFIEAGTIVPADETNIHFGAGQEETEVTLSPGKHTLTLQFADGAHMSYGENMSNTITVNVVK